MMNKKFKLWFFIVLDIIVTVVFFFMLWGYEADTYTWMIPEGFDQPQQVWQQ